MEYLKQQYYKLKNELVLIKTQLAKAEASCQKLRQEVRHLKQVADRNQSNTSS